MTELDQNDTQLLDKEISMNRTGIYRLMIPISIVIGSLIIRKYFPISRKVLLQSVAKVSNLQNASNLMFGGVGIDKLNEIAQSTSRGVKVVVQGDELLYFYKSASGKTVNVVKFVIDRSGELFGYLGGGPHFAASSPRRFADNLVEVMELLKK